MGQWVLFNVYTEIFFYKNKNKNIKKKTSRTLDDVIPAKSKQYSSGGSCIIHLLCLYSCYDNTFEMGREQPDS